MKILLFAAAMFAFTAEAAAQMAPSVEDTPEIYVTGQRIEEAVRAFVGELSVEAGSENQLARWEQRVCPGVVGLRTAQAQAVADRIAIRALEVGLDVGEPGCRPNVLILVSSDSDALARRLLEHHGALLARFTDAGVNTRGRAALADFVNTPRAVRWWHVAQTSSADGIRANPNGDHDIGGSIDPGEGVRAPAGASRINRATRQDLARAIIIVDGRRAASAPVGQLADYLSMVALAQLDPSADTSAYPTILNLFAEGPGGSRPTAMTEWDRSYLEGLYRAPNARLASSQQRAIERAMIESANASPDP